MNAMQIARDVFLHQVIQQTALQAIQDFTAAGKLVAAKKGNLVFVLIVLQLNALDRVVFLLHISQQLAG